MRERQVGATANREGPAGLERKGLNFRVLATPLRQSCILLRGIEARPSPCQCSPIGV